MVLVKKCQIFLYLDLIEIRVEIMLNNFVEKKETFSLKIRLEIVLTDFVNKKETFLTIKS